MSFAVAKTCSGPDTSSNCTCAKATISITRGMPGEDRGDFCAFAERYRAKFWLSTLPTMIPRHRAAIRPAIRAMQPHLNALYLARSEGQLASPARAASHISFGDGGSVGICAGRRAIVNLQTDIDSGEHDDNDDVHQNRATRLAADLLEGDRRQDLRQRLRLLRGRRYLPSRRRGMEWARKYPREPARVHRYRIHRASRCHRVLGRRVT